MSAITKTLSQIGTVLVLFSFAGPALATAAEEPDSLASGNSASVHANTIDGVQTNSEPPVLLTPAAPLTSESPMLDQRAPQPDKASTVLQGHVVRPAITSSPKPNTAPATANAVSASDDLFEIVNKLQVRVPIKPDEKGNPVKSALRQTASLANFALDLRGWDFSKEGADAILDEKVNLKSRFAKEYIQRACYDQQELHLINGIMRMADCFHSSDLTGRKKKSEAYSDVQRDIGDEEIVGLIAKLKEIDRHPIKPVAWKDTWDLTDRQKKAETIFEAAADRDPIVKQYKDKLHKYNQRNKFAQVSAKVVYSTLAIAGSTPTIAAPIASATMLAYMMATGGPEQDKLLREIYLSKCLESRYRQIAEKTNLVTECYNRAVATKNSTLLVCTRDLLTHMTDAHTSQVVLDDAQAGICRNVEPKSPNNLIAMPHTVTR